MADAEKPLGTGFGPGLYWSAIGVLAGIATTQASSNFLDTLSPWAAPVVVAMIVSGVIRVGVTRYRHELRRRPWKGKGNPYPGLEPYGPDRADVFCGRDREVKELSDRVRRREPAVARRFIPVVGPSGCGKSSLVMAGLVPSLQSTSGWSSVAIGPVFAPGDDPIAALAKALVTRLPDENVDRLAAALTEESRLAADAKALGGRMPKPEHLDAALLRIAGRGGRVVVVVDQLEDLVGAGEEPRRVFFALLEAALAANDRLVVVATLRSEALLHFREGPGSDLVRYAQQVNAMDYVQLRAVVKEPAAKADVTIADPLVDKMVQAAQAMQGADALPVLSYVLHSLYADPDVIGDKRITDDEYERVGGPEGVIVKRAQDTLDELALTRPEPYDEVVALVMDTWLNFVNVGGLEVSRRRARIRDLDRDVRQREVVNAYVAVGFLVRHGDQDATAEVEVRHEAILRVWPDLVRHIAVNAAALAERASLEPLAKAWDKGGRRGVLIPAERAMQAGTSPIVRIGVVKDFLDASMSNDDQRKTAVADIAARAGLDALKHDPEQAIRIAQAAAAVTRTPTESARSALYRTWASGLRAVFRDHEGVDWGVVSCLAWAPDGRLASASEDGKVRVWGADGRLLHTLADHGAPVRSLAWSSDGRLASGSDDRTVRVWNGATCLQVHAGHDGPVWSVAWSGAGRLASGSHDGMVRVWASDGRPSPVLPGHEGPVRSVAWSLEGLLASGSDDRAVRLWSADGQPLRTLGGHTGPVRSVAWASNGRLAAASDDKTIRVWTLAGTKLVHVLSGHDAPVTAVAWSSDGRLASCSQDQTIRIWGADRQVIHSLIGHDGSVETIAWSADGRLASGSSDRSIRVWGADRQMMHTLAGHDGSVASVAWSTDGRLASGSDDRSVRVWNVADHTFEEVQIDKRVSVGVAWSFDGRLAFGTGDPRISVRGIDGSLHGLTPNQRRAVVSLAWSRDGRLALGHKTGSILTCSPDGRVLARLNGHEHTPVRAVAWSPDGRLASGSDDTTVRIWSSDGKPLHVLEGHDGPVRSVSWSPDGRIASASDDCTVGVWSGDGRFLYALDGHQGSVRSVDWSPDGRLASGSGDSKVRVWSTDGDLLHELTGHHGPVRSVAWSSDGRLASASDDATVKVWPDPASVEHLLAIVNEVMFRELTAEERRRLLLPDPHYAPTRGPSIDRLAA